MRIGSEESSAYTSEVTEEDFGQARALRRILERDGELEAFVYNVVAHLKSAVPPVQQGPAGESPRALLI